MVETLIPQGTPTKTKPLAIVALLLSVVLVSLSHYLTPLELAGFHDVFRRLYYLPIFFGAALGGKRGGLAIAILSGLLYAPHILFQWEAQGGHHGHHGGHLNKYIEITIFLLFGALFGAVFDRLRAATEALKRSYEATQTSARLAALGQLSAGLAHEIRTPLTGIRSSLDVIEGECEEREDEVVGEFLGLARREIDRADRLIGELLNFAKPKALHRTEVDVPQLIEESKALIEPEAQKKNVQIELECEAGQKLNGDPDQLKQVFLNLMLNAIQHAPGEGGRVLVQARSAKKEGFQLAVSDNGPGVSPEHGEAVFDPFFTTRAKGVGLGLAISHQIIESHGGDLTHASSETLGGASFLIQLPIS